jgi:hypothetical protein
MAFIIGPGPGQNYTLAAGAAVRFRWGWSDFPAGRGTVLLFAIPAFIRTDANRAVSYNNGVEQNGSVVLYSVDIRCEDITGTGIATAFQIGGGGLV